MVISCKNDQECRIVYNLKFDWKHRDKYDRWWIYNTTDTENLLYQQPTSNDKVAVEAPQQVDPNTFKTIK